MKRLFIVGLGDVGRRIREALAKDGWTVQVVTRSEGWPAALDPADDATRLIAVREDDLAGVLNRFPRGLRGRLMLVQNGFLEVRLDGLGPVSRGLIYFTAKGDFFKVLAPSVFHGPLAAPIAEGLERGGIAARVEPDRGAFLRTMIVKGLWNSAVGLPPAAHQVDLGTYLDDRGDEFEALVDEGARAAGAAYGVTVAGADAARVIRESTVPLRHMRGGTTALAWRNGAIATMGRRHGVPTPVNDRLLAMVGYEVEAAR